MSLRRQMLLVGSLAFAVPLVAWWGIDALHRALRELRVAEQTLAAARLGATLERDEDVRAALAARALAAGADDWYAERAPAALVVDGYADDWRTLAEPARRQGGRPGLALRVARHRDTLYLLARVRDERVLYHRPPPLVVDAGEGEQVPATERLANGDALELYVEGPDGAAVHALLQAMAPGPLVPLALPPAASHGRGWRVRLSEAPPTRPLPGWRAEWVEVAGGYQVELALPLPAVGSRVGIAAIDVDRAGAARDRWVGSMAPAAMRAARAGAPATAGGRLHHEDRELRRLLAEWVAPGQRARLYDAAGRLVAEVDALYARRDAGTVADADETTVVSEDETPPGDAPGLIDALLTRLFAWLAAGDLPLLPETDKRIEPPRLDPARIAAFEAEGPTRRYVTAANDRVLGTLAPLEAGAARGRLLIESNEEHVSAYAERPLARLFAALVAVAFVVAAALLAWATRLSLRVRALSRAASRAVADDGRPRLRAVALPERRARDELGELSRDMAALLERSGAYARHLEALSGRLAHELRTPLAIARTSLEALDRRRLGADEATLVARADDALARLATVVRALVESTRLERALGGARFVPLALDRWLGEAAEGIARARPALVLRLLGSVEALGPDGIAADAPPPPPLRRRGSPEWLAQALEKLVDNAADFAADGEIALVLAPDAAGGVLLAVANRGAALGAARETLFAARAGAGGGRAGTRAADGTPHLGLGTIVVRLVAEAHGGLPVALDRPPWVLVGLRLPPEADAA